MAVFSNQKFHSHWRSVYKGDLEIPFSERLLSVLFYHTDVGLIPRARGSALSISPQSFHCNDINWKKPITGCYLCSRANTSHQGICCSPACLIHFHEWCVHKVNKTTQFCICLFPGCEEENVNPSCNVCSQEHYNEYSARFTIISQDNDVLVTSPKWYIDTTGHIPNQSTDSEVIIEVQLTTSSNQSNHDTSCDDVIMKGSDSRLFIFSKTLYEGLIYKTDVGAIPRDSYRGEHSQSPFSNYANWCVAIEGCYSCGKATNPNQYMYVCDKKCYQNFHEWCRKKLSEFSGECLCMYPGCEQVAIGDARFCSEAHQNDLEKNYKSIHSISLTKTPIKCPSWYKGKRKSTDQKITSFFHKTDVLDADSGLQDSNVSILSEHSGIAEQSFSEADSKHSFLT